MDNVQEEKNDWVATYEVHLKIPRSEISLYELEHPEYDTEQQFIAIMGVWEREKMNWYRMWREGLPKPKRRPGRPKDAAAYAERKAFEAARAARRAERELRKKEEERRREARKKNSVVEVALPDELAAALYSVKGDLPLDECIRQLLAVALGPLVQKTPT